MKPIVCLAFIIDETKLKDKYGGFIKGQSKIQQAAVSEQPHLGTGVQSRIISFRRHYLSDFKADFSNSY